MVCVLLPAPSLAQTRPDIVILDPTETVRMEHDDRVVRIKRAAEALGLTPAPTFSETVVPADQLPADFRVDTPVLRVVFSERSLFDSARSTLRPEAGAMLEAIAAALRGDAPDAAVFVAGHTDDRGSESYNHDLSVTRAEAVAQRLLAAGVGEVALWRVGFGESVPLYPNDTDAHLAFNRRVEFLFAARTEPVLDVLRRQLDTICVSSSPEASARCKREVKVRDSFEAVQVTQRSLALAARPPRSLQTRRSAAGTAHVAAGHTTLQTGRPALRTMSASVRVGHAGVAPPVRTDLVLAPKRISFNLKARFYDLNIPVNSTGAARRR